MQVPAHRILVTKSVDSKACSPSATAVKTFVHDLQRHKKARMDLTAIVEGTPEKPAVEFTGSFVALV